MKVALLGMGPSADGYARYCAVRGGRHACFDAVWTVNAFGDIFGADLVFHMDDVRIQERRAQAGNDQVGRMLEGFKQPGPPILTSCPHPDYPRLEAYPLELVLERTGGPTYFNGTSAYAVAYAIAMGVKTLGCWGLDYAYHRKFIGERGRACVEYWIGRAVGGMSKEEGMSVLLPRETFLMDTRLGLQLYGYDCSRVEIKDVDGKPTVTITDNPEDKWPSAEDIEKRYDHLIRIDGGENADVQSLRGDQAARTVLLEGRQEGQDQEGELVQGVREGCAA